MMYNYYKRKRRRIRFRCKVVIVVSLMFLVTATLVRIQLYNTPTPQQPAAIALLFLVRQDLPLDFLWHSFLQNADAAHYTIFLHSEPGFVFDDTTTRSSFFFNRQLTNSIQVGWGESSMIEAERLLLRAALQNPLNQRFVLLSDSCVPLYNFTYIYNYLMGSPRSFVDSFLDRKEGRYNPRMSSLIPMRKWRKGSQWTALVRSHAKVVAFDGVVFPVFKRLCKEAMNKDTLDRVREPNFRNLKGYLENAYIHPVFKDDASDDDHYDDGAVIIPTKRHSRRNTPEPSRKSDGSMSSLPQVIEENHKP